jgi:hypothetical protein
MSTVVFKPHRTEIANHSLQSLSVERAKEQLYLYDEDSDSLINRYIQSATSILENWLCYYLMPADITAYFNYCGQCSVAYLLGARPFNSLVSVEVLQGGSYVALTSEQYSLQVTDWEAHLKLCESLTVDSDCGDVDPIKVTYKVGKYNELSITDITATENTALVTVASPHNLQNGDQVIISGTGEDDLNGTYSVTIVSATTFEYTYVGTPGLASVTGLATIPLIPNALEQALLEMVASMFTNRGDCSDSCGPVPCSAQAKAGLYKRRIIRTNKGPVYACCCN